MDGGLPNLPMIPQPTEHLPLSSVTSSRARYTQKQGARPALRRTGPLVLPSGRGTARRAPTEILEQDRPHHIPPVFNGPASLDQVGLWLSFPSAAAKDFLLQQSGVSSWIEHPSRVTDPRIQFDPSPHGRSLGNQTTFSWFQDPSGAAPCSDELVVSLEQRQAHYMVQSYLNEYQQRKPDH